MNEAEWLGCDDPRPMLEFLRGKASDRKLRLFACACCRAVWSMLRNRGKEDAVATAESYADGLVGDRQLKDAAAKAWESGKPLYPPAKLLAKATTAQQALAGAEFAATAWLGAQSEDRRKAEQCEILRDIFGNPFNPLTIESAWLEWNDGAIRKMAQSIYDARAFDHLPLLADALKEADCIDIDILSHCRTPGDHVRGCWVVDLLLGKS